MTVAGINIFLFILWSIVAYIIMAVVLTISILMIDFGIQKIFRRGR